MPICLYKQHARKHLEIMKASRNQFDRSRLEQRFKLNYASNNVESSLIEHAQICICVNVMLCCVFEGLSNYFILRRNSGDCISSLLLWFLTAVQRKDREKLIFNRKVFVQMSPSLRKTRLNSRVSCSYFGSREWISYVVSKWPISWTSGH